MAMRILFSMFWFAILIFGVLKCEAVNFDKYRSAGANSMFISNFWHTMYTQEWLACLHAWTAQSVHDITAHAVTPGMMLALLSLHANKLDPTFHMCCV